MRLALGLGDLRFQRNSAALRSALNTGLTEPRNTYLPCYNTQFMDSSTWTWLAAYERYGHKAGRPATLVSQDDAIVLERRRQTGEYRRHWRIVQSETKIPIFAAAGVFFLGLYVDAYREGRMEEVLEKFRQLFNGRRILFVAPTTPMGGQSFAQQLPLMRRLGLHSAQFIAVPETDAYAATPRVLAEIEKARGYDDIFLSAGPAASVWAHQLAGRRDGRVLDVGSFNTQLRYLA